jgi:hypothetical protein
MTNTVQAPLLPTTTNTIQAPPPPITNTVQASPPPITTNTVQAPTPPIVTNTVQAPSPIATNTVPARLSFMNKFGNWLGQLIFPCLCWMTIGRKSLEQFRQDEQRNGWEACNMHLRDTVVQITTIVGILSTLRVISVVSTDMSVFLARVGPCRVRCVFDYQPSYSNQLYYP